MQSKNILVVALRIGAIIVAINIFEKLPSGLMNYDFSTARSWYMFAGFNLLPSLIFLLVAILMWFNPKIFLQHISNVEK